MSHTWKLLPLAVLFALGAFMLVLGSGPKPEIASANITDVDLVGDVLTVQADADSGDLTIELSSIESDTDTEMEITDCNGCIEEGDFDSEFLTVDTTDADYDGFVEVTLDISCPNDPDNIRITVTDDDGEEEVTFRCEPSVTPTPTKTVGPAATINITSSNVNLGCGATSIVTITVLDEEGDPAAPGTLVQIVADKGNVSPASGQTTADGSVFVFYTAPSDSGGEATITAAAGSAIGTTTIDIDCNTAPTQAPPPTTAPPTNGGIQPPNTGDAGLRTSGNTWQAYAGIALVMAATIGTLAVVRPRA